MLLIKFVLSVFLCYFFGIELVLILSLSLISFFCYLFIRIFEPFPSKSENITQEFSELLQCPFYFILYAFFMGLCDLRNLIVFNFILITILIAWSDFFLIFKKLFYYFKQEKYFHQSHSYLLFP